MSWAALGMGALNTLVGNLSDSHGSGRKARHTKQDEEHALYLRREREGIMARTEGAKAAGLHPLVGMGFQAGPGPSTVVGANPIQSGYVDPPAPERQQREPEDPSIARYNAARARLAEAQATQAERDLEASQRRLATQPGQPTPLDTNPDNRRNPNVKVIPNEIPAGSKGFEAGTHQALARIEVAPGRYLNVPTGKLKQALEDNELAGSVALALANRNALGTYFTQDIPAALGFTGPRIKLSEPGRARGAYVPQYAPRFQKRRRQGGATGSW